jgi:hypothetical protein
MATTVFVVTTEVMYGAYSACKCEKSCPIWENTIKVFTTLLAAEDYVNSCCDCLDRMITKVVVEE